MPPIRYWTLVSSPPERRRWRRASPFTRWCPGQDSNLHTLRQRLLRPSCLPFHHPGKSDSHRACRRPIAQGKRNVFSDFRNAYRLVELTTKYTKHTKGTCGLEQKPSRPLL